MGSTCRYCGNHGYGHSCTHSPTMKHEHVDDEKHCEWCGSTSYGSACPFSPTGKHRHGHGANKCIWCGSTSTGPACPFSPSGIHEVGEAAGSDAKVTVPIKINGQDTPMTLISLGGKWRIEKFDFPIT